MKKEFVTYEQALALKELGFDEPCMAYYNEDGEFWDINPMTNSSMNHEEAVGICITAPLYQQAFRWFREKHKINSGIVPHYDYFYFIIKNFGSGEEYYSDDMIELTYEEAESACLDKLIEICKNK